MPSDPKTQPLTRPEIVEQVARAIQEEDEGESYASAARAAALALLDAIREPSEAMIRAVPLSDVVGDNIYDIWRAMIDALRKEIAG